MDNDLTEINTSTLSGTNKMEHLTAETLENEFGKTLNRTLFRRADGSSMEFGLIEDGASTMESMNLLNNCALLIQVR